jgi:hypothetical protein
MTAAATVSHFSSGFVGTLTRDASDVEGAANPTDAGEAPDQSAPQDATILQDATSSQDANPFEGDAPADGGPVESDSSVDAGTTIVSSLVQGASPTAGSVVAITVDEWSSVPDADGGCTGQVMTGHQQTTVPASALPHQFSFAFSDASTTACNRRTYDISVTDSDSGGNVLASGTNSCGGVFGVPVTCNISLALAATDATIVSGLVQGATPAAGSTVAVVVDEWSSAPDADGGCTGQVMTGRQQTTVPASALPYVFRLSFSDPSTTACTTRTYDVSVTDDDSGGNVVASGTNSCTGTFGAPVSCGVSLVLAPVDAGPPMADGSPDAAVDAGDLLTSTIQFNGTLTGTVPPGASYLYIALMASTDPASTMNNMPFCSPTVPNFGMADNRVVPPTLPATYSFSFGPNLNICGASFEIEAYPLNGSFSQLPGSVVATTPCGRIGTGNTGGGTPIESTSVTCDLALP